MTSILPSFVFPEPAPSLPTWPAFTDAPFKPGNNPSDHMRMYLQYVLGDRYNYPASGFGSPTASVHIADIIEPFLLGTNPDSDTAWTEQIHAVQIYCLVCPPMENGDRKGETDEVGWPFCGGGDDVGSESTFDQILDWAPQSGGVSQGLAVPEPSFGKPSSGWGSISLACALAMYTTSDIIDGTVPLYMNRPSVKSQVFIVSGAPRNGASDPGVLMPYRYNVACPLGSQNGSACDNTEPSSTSSYTPVPTSTQDMWVALFPTATSTTSARNSIDVCVESRFNRCRTDGWYGWPVGQRVGVIICVVVGFIILLLLLRRFSQSKWSHKREKAKPMLLSELRRQQAAEEGVAAERRYVERLYGEHASTSRGSRDRIEQPPEDVPPTYNEAMKDRRRTPAEDAPQMNEDASAGRPPVYSNVVQQPAPVADTSSRTPYPALPASPRR